MPVVPPICGGSDVHQAQLTRMPGVEATAARAILAALSPEMRHCGSAARRASGAGVCPGPDERAGTRRSGRTRQGHRSLRRGSGRVPGPPANPRPS